jgi:DNA-binding transcriptional ArsR family regulator
MADPSRAAVLMELTDARALPPSELAEVAGVSRSAMSEHLAKLRKAGFLAVERGGRNRYYRLAGPEVATAVEALAALAPRSEVRGLRQANRAGALGAARTCYGHLAGRLGVAVTKRLFELDWIERTERRRVVRVTKVGRRELGRRLYI